MGAKFTYDTFINTDAQFKDIVDNEIGGLINKLANNMRQSSELDYLIYNKLAEYVKLILNGEMKKYLKT